ncbi:hypothetical protein FHX15_004658 [Rhizobium sp. BK650]|nr:hypothetical protein [Rhizobium sp. BK650]
MLPPPVLLRELVIGGSCWSGSASADQVRYTLQNRHWSSHQGSFGGVGRNWHFTITDLMIANYRLADIGCSGRSPGLFSGGGFVGDTGGRSKTGVASTRVHDAVSARGPSPDKAEES